jgi:hypothetical protein
MKGMAMTLTGSCHCGNLSVRFDTAIAPEEIEVRACQCSFCRRHNQRSVTDPQGSVTIGVADPELLSRYRFGLATADFLVCRRCGVYLGAVMEDDGLVWATINVNALDDRDRFGAGKAVTFEGEEAGGRVARRKAKWTPARYA